MVRRNMGADCLAVRDVSGRPLNFLCLPHSATIQVMTAINYIFEINIVVYMYI
jgi:hypothetical protein